MARRGRDNPSAIGHEDGEAGWDEAEKAEKAEEALEQAQLLDVPPDPRTAPTSAPLEEWSSSAVSYVASNVVTAPVADLDDPDLPYWLALNRIRGIGPARFRLLLDAHGSAERVWRGDARGWQAAGLDARTAAAFEAQRRRIAPEVELERLVRLRVGALRFTDPGYPRLLCEIAQPPAILYIRGTLTAADEWALAVVGTRRATMYGKQITERLVGELARQAITIVSGLARGIDSHAHAAALEAGGAPLPCWGAGLIWSIRRKTPSSPHASSSRGRSSRSSLPERSRRRATSQHATG